MFSSRRFPTFFEAHLAHDIALDIGRMLIELWLLAIKALHSYLIEQTNSLGKYENWSCGTTEPERPHCNIPALKSHGTG